MALFAPCWSHATTFHLYLCQRMILLVSRSVRLIYNSNFSLHVNKFRTRNGMFCLYGISLQSRMPTSIEMSQNRIVCSWCMPPANLYYFCRLTDASHRASPASCSTLPTASPSYRA